jgi:hypothetical protein
VKYWSCLMLVCCCIAFSPVTGNAQESEIRALFEEHNRYFSRGDATAISQRTATAPLWVGSSPPAVFETPLDVETRFALAISKIRKAGYDHSEILDLTVRLINSRSAVVDLAFRRYTRTGTVMGEQRREATYWVLRTDSGWRIAGMASRDM